MRRSRLVLPLLTAPLRALLNPESGKGLDDIGWSATPGTQLQIWSCTGAANQSWTLPG